MARTLQRHPRARILLRVLLASLLFVPLVLTARTDAGAIHDTVFELDGNTHENQAGAPWDWTTFFDATGAALALPANFYDSGFDSDHAFPDTSTYTGGSKDTLDVSKWSCTDSNNLGGKFDIINAYSTIYQDPDSGDLLLFFGIERAATEGAGNMGFWFLKDGSVDCNKTQSGKAPSFTGTHQNGDIFVVASFTNGGAQANVTAYEWKGGSDGFLDVNNPFVSGQMCTATAHDACGIVNTQPILTGANKPWTSPSKSGADGLDINAFYEGFVRVPAASVSGCFATFIANTRSSPSPTATIHDFSRGFFPRCQSGTELTLHSYQIGTADPVTSGVSNPSITVLTGQQLKLVFAEENKGNFPLEKPTAGSYVVIPDATQAGACVLGEVQVAGFNVGDTNQNGKLDGGEVWRYECTVTAGSTTPTTITAFGHGIDELTSPPAKKDVTWCATVNNALVEDTVNNPRLAPATTVHCDQRERTDVSITVQAPSTAMTASVEATIIFYEKNDGNAALAKPGNSDFVQLSGTNQCTSFGQVLQEVGDPHPGKNVGDLNGNDLLDPQETWQWRCTKSITATTSHSSSSVGTGHGIVGSLDVTYCTTPPTADQIVHLPGTSTPATALCDVDERRTVTINVG